MDNIKNGDYEKEFLGMIFSERCEKDSSQWVTTVGRNYEDSPGFYWLDKDTITYCP